MRSSTLTAGPHIKLSLLGGFALRIAAVEVRLPPHARRVAAFLALDRAAEKDCDRGVAASRLWPDAFPDRARASLRTALWCMRKTDPRLVCGNLERVRLSDAVDVDVHAFRARAERVLADKTQTLEDYQRLVGWTAELLPGWNEEWLQLAREQLRQLRLHAMEAAARQLGERGRHAEAIDVMLALVAEEPLRESAQTALIDAHIREGNLLEARRQFKKFSDALWTATGLRPGPELCRKVGAHPPVAARPFVGRTTRVKAPSTPRLPASERSHRQSDLAQQRI